MFSFATFSYFIPAGMGFIALLFIAWLGFPQMYMQHSFSPLPLLKMFYSIFNWSKINVFIRLDNE